MSVATLTEKLVPLTAAATLFPEGVRPSLSALARWSSVGIRRVRLRTRLVGGRRYTSAAAVTEFLDALNDEPERPEV
jgi:hypothetical protein